VELFPLFDRHLNDAEGCAIPPWRERRVALRHDMALARHAFAPKRPMASSVDRFFRVDGFGLVNEDLFDLRKVGSAGGNIREAGLHAFEGPEEVDRS